MYFILLIILFFSALHSMDQFQLPEVNFNYGSYYDFQPYEIESSKQKLPDKQKLSSKKSENSEKIAWDSLPTEIQKHIILYNRDFKNACNNLAKTILNIKKRDTKKEVSAYIPNFTQIAKFNHSVTIDGNKVKFFMEKYDSDGDNDDYENEMVYTHGPKTINCYGAIQNLEVYVSFANGEAYQLRDPYNFGILNTRRLHQGSITDTDVIGRDLISVGEDGFLCRWDAAADSLLKIKVDDLIKSMPQYITYLKDDKLLLVVSANGDYYYVDEQFNVIGRIDHTRLASLSIPKNHIIANEPCIIECLIELKKNGCSFKEFALIRALDLAIYKQRSYLLHEKEDYFRQQYPRLIQKLREKKYVGKEQAIYAYMQRAFGSTIMSGALTIKNLHWSTITSEVLKFGWNFGLALADDDD